MLYLFIWQNSYETRKSDYWVLYIFFYRYCSAIKEGVKRGTNRFVIHNRNLEYGYKKHKFLELSSDTPHVITAKAVGRGDKTTRRVQVRVLALLENPRRDQVRVLALLENPRRDWVLDPALLETPRRERVLDCSRLVSGHPRPRSMDRGMRMSTDESRASNHGSKWNQN